MGDGSQKISLITGASSGIGLEVAKQLIAKGHRVLLVGRRPLSDIDHVFPDDTCYIEADFSQPKIAVEQIIAKLTELNIGHLDHVIQCAGLGYYVSPLDEDMSRLVDTLNVNTLFPILLTRQLVPMLEKTSGKLTLIGSVAHKGSPNMASYAASKAGIHGFARSLQSEWEDRIAVQVLHPGPTLTPMLDKAGYEMGWEKHLFVPVETMASEIVRLIGTNKKTASIFAMAKIKSLFSWGIKP